MSNNEDKGHPEDKGHATTYIIEGMTCQGCVASLTRALEAGHAQGVSVDLAQSSATAYGLSEAAVRKIVEDAGFSVVSVSAEG